MLSLWKFRGSDVLFGLLLFGVFMPFQVVLLPMSQVLGMLGLSSSITGLVLVHCLAGLAGTTLFFHNYYAAIPEGAGECGAHGRGELLADLLAHRAAAVHAHLHGHAHLAVHQHLERLPVRRGVLGHRVKPITVGLNNLANTSSSVKATTWTWLPPSSRACPPWPSMCWPESFLCAG